MNLAFGIDNGNYQTKYSNGSFISGINRHDSIPALTDDYLEYDGVYYTLSNKRVPYNKDKTTDKTCFILTLFALVKELELYAKKSDRFHNIYLTADLPPQHYSRLKEPLRKYFTNNFANGISFKYGKRKYNINLLGVSIIPQAYAAVLANPSDFLDYPICYVIDIGGYTVDVLMMVNGRPDMSVCLSLDTGVITMYNKIRERVLEHADITLEDQVIENVLTNGKHICSNDIVDIIKKETEIHTKHILDELRENKIDLRSNPAIFLGGGSVLLSDYISNSPLTASIEFIKDVTANAKGCKIKSEDAMKKLALVS